MATVADQRDRTMMIADHIKELRTRFFGVALVFLVGSTLAYSYRDEIIHILLRPLGDQQLIYLTPGGGFSFVLLVSLYGGLALALPLLVQQLYAFLRPMLPHRVQKASGMLVLSSMSLMMGGILFGYFLAIPGALNFLSTFAESYVQASLTAESYLSFVTAYTLGLGAIFQLPIFMIILHWVKPLTLAKVFRFEKWIILLAFIAAAIITPTPDPLNQTIVALPVIVTYQIGVIAIAISIRRNRKQPSESQ